MAFCSTCGAELNDGARFCHVCGAAVATSTATTLTTTVASPLTTAGNYDLVLLTIGTCPDTQADDVLQDLLGYSELDAFELLTMLPAQIAQDLTEKQALYLAQALTEYGMDVAVYYGDTPVDLTAKATTPVYKSDGSIVKSVLSTLATIALSSRVRSFRPWTKPVPPRARFVPHYEPAPPVHVRRTIAHPVELRRYDPPRHVTPANRPGTMHQIRPKGQHGQGHTNRNHRGHRP